MSRPRAVVIGAGITGLTAAWEIARSRPDVELVVLESRSRPGGNIVTEEQSGFLLDGGPDSFLRTKPQAVELCKELGLDGELITTLPRARNVYMAYRGQLERMPAGMALAVPSRFGPLIGTRLIGPLGKLRVLGDLWVRRPDALGDESIATFIARRFGHEVAHKLASPLLGGIYAGDVSELSILSTFPQLAELERKHGSLIIGLLKAQAAMRGRPTSTPRAVADWLGRAASPAPSPFQSLRRGMGSLIDALVERLPPVRVDSAVRSVSRVGEEFRVALDDGTTLLASAVVFAAPAHVGAQVLFDGALGDELGQIPYLSTATVFFGFREQDIERSLDGVGFIVPRGEARVLAGTWVSSKWAGRAPDGHVLLRAFLGGSRGDVDVPHESDEHLADVALTELRRLMGRLGEPLFTRVFRYHDSNPQPVVGHAARLARLDDRVGQIPGLALCGAAFDGVGIPDCVRQGRAAASRALARI